jgi:1-deoxy-D-xylulose-5-phosphate synthase
MDNKRKSITQDSILDSINSPEDLKRLPFESLQTLADEVRNLIIETVSERGGHLASSLGVVELTIALLRVFSPPDDRFVFDVGHQAYAYKILTGRRDRFRSLRSRGGISGFPKRRESEYDFFDTGHAGNAISVAAGLAQARCLDGNAHKVVAIVGDGSLTCGVSFEGLNQAGALEKDLIIILNDNEMSISPNVGAMAGYLNRIMTGQVVTRFRDEIKNILKNLPGVMGKSIYSMARQFEDALKGFITPGRLFEDLGFNYVGPIDGHHLRHLIETLTNVRRFRKPVLVHAITCKGKGYCQAEENPSQFHGVGPFEIESGKVYSSGGPATYTTVFGNTMIKLAETDPKIIAITAAMEYGTGLAEFGQIYPKRFFDVGIAEQHGVVFAAGLALEGYKPVVAIYSTFIQRGYDHIIHDVCMQNLPVVFALDRAGIVGEDGPTHHGVFDIAFTRHLPNLVAMAPSNEDELADMLFTALKFGAPCAIRYPRAKGAGVCVKQFPELIEVGKGVVERQGTDLAIIALGSMVETALRASDILLAAGISAAVVNPRFVKPLDNDLIKSLAESTGKLIIVEEGILAGGFGSAVLELLADEGLTDVKVVRIGIPDEFVEHGTREELLSDYGLTPEGIVMAAYSLKAGSGMMNFTSPSQGVGAIPH